MDGVGPAGNNVCRDIYVLKAGDFILPKTVHERILVDHIGNILDIVPPNPIQYAPVAKSRLHNPADGKVVAIHV